MLKRRILIGMVITLTTAFGAINTASAALPGIYLGGQLGWSNTHWSLSNIPGIVAYPSLVPSNALAITGRLSSGSVDTNGLAGRAFLGYQFNDYWATEFGYSRFNNSDVRNAYVFIPTTTGLINLRAADQNIREYAVDAVAKGIWPLCNCFGLYGKFGAAYINASGKYNNNANHINPTFGLGLSYDVTPNVPIDVSWNRIQKVGSSQIPSTDLVTLGVGYHFG
jgi:OmpA-OmpF porin, OOP family